MPDTALSGGESTKIHTVGQGSDTIAKKADSRFFLSRESAFSLYHLFKLILGNDGDAERARFVELAPGGFSGENI